MANLVMASWWRNDEKRNLEGRAAHLLEKTFPGGSLRFVWVIGDSADQTEAHLRWRAQLSGRDVTIIRHDTHIDGADVESRMRRLSATGNAAFDTVRADDDAWIMHESDLVSPVDVAWRLAAVGQPVVGGWVTLGEQFYDIWAYMKDGVHFSNAAPYHACYNADMPFEVDCIGSVVLFPAAELRAGVRFQTRAVMDLCAAMKARGLSIWCDPRIHIEQPVELWTPWVFPSEVSYAHI